MAAGVFDGQPTDWLKMELIEGELIEKMPQNRPHSIALAKGQRALSHAFAADCYIAVQAPLQVDAESEPDAYADHPTGKDVRLVLEVSDTTPPHDRQIKTRLYARAGVPEYWILILKSRTLEVRRNPLPSPEDEQRWEYQTVQVLREDDSLMPLYAPDAAIRVADLLPDAG